MTSEQLLQKATIEHRIEDDSFDHEFGTEHSEHLEIDARNVTGIVTDDYLELSIRTTYEQGGCNYEPDMDDYGRVHYHRCGASCREYSFTIDWELVSARKVDGRYEVTYKPIDTSVFL